MVKFGFIGGTKRGYKLINALFDKELLPEFAIILKEDDHENVKYHEKISDMLNQKKIPNFIKNKLGKSDYDLIKDSNVDVIILYGWRTLIDTRITSRIKYGIIAAHQSLLPNYRGFAPLQWVIINDEKETGVTLFQITEGEVDSGKIISQAKVEIDLNEYASELDDKLINITIEHFFNVLENIEKGELRLVEQDETKATYACKRIPDDGLIDWNKSTREIFNLIRALAYPFTGSFCRYGDDTYIIRKARIGDNDDKIYSGRIPGRVIKILPEGIEILTGDGSILISEWENSKTGNVSCPSAEIKTLSVTLY
ncbi:MAG: methionyl-tRNA formyltransferase [bacterium]|nr:methionyl-tRNA formyltransferase [bacterium]